MSIATAGTAMRSAQSISRSKKSRKRVIYFWVPPHKRRAAHKKAPKQWRKVKGHQRSRTVRN